MSIRRLLNAVWNSNRMAPQGSCAKASRGARLLLETLETRLVPAAVANANVVAGTLTINEMTAGNDSVTMTGAKMCHVVDSAGSTSYANVSNIIFNANVNGIDLTFAGNASFNVSGNVSVNGLGAFNGLSVDFENSFNVLGQVTVANTGAGSSLEVDAGEDTFGSLLVNGGSAVNQSSTFMTIGHSLHNGSVTGVLVDLEGTQIDGSATIFLGGGGGYFLTDCSLDLGNSSNDSVSNASTVDILGNLSVTDLHIRNFDVLDLDKGEVSGNLSINVASIGSSETVDVMNYSVAKATTITINGTAGSEEAVYVDNCSLKGNLAVNGTSTGEVAAYAEVDGSTIKGNLNVTQPEGQDDEFYLAGMPNVSSISGAVNINVAGDGSAYISNMSINGSVSVTQVGVNSNEFHIENSSLNGGSLTINQPTVAKMNEAYVEGDTVLNGNVTIDQSACTNNGLVEISGDSIDGYLAINTALKPGGHQSDVDLGNDSKIGGAVTINAAAGYENEVTLENDAAIDGAVTITESNGSSAQNFIGVSNVSTTLGVTLKEQGGSQDNDVDVNDGTMIGGNLSINQPGAGEEDEVDVDTGAHVTGVLAINQAAAASDTITVANDASVAQNLSISQTSNDQSDVLFQFASITGNVLIDQPAVAVNNSVSVINSSAHAVAINLAGSAGEGDVDFTNDSIGGNVSINEGPTGPGQQETFEIATTSISGNVSINQGGSNENYVYIQHNVSINGNVVLAQSNPMSYEADVHFASGLAIDGSVTINQSGATYNEVDDATPITGNLSINQGGGGHDDIIDLGANVSGNVAVKQGNAESDHFNASNASFGQNVSINELSGVNAIDVDDTVSINGALVVNGANGVNSLDLESGVTVGQLSLTFGGGNNFVDVFDTTIAGSTTMSLGVNGIGNNQVDFGSDPDGTKETVFDGNVSVNMGAGTNLVQIGLNESTSFANNTSAAFTANTSAVSSKNIGNDTLGTKPTFVDF